MYGGATWRDYEPSRGPWSPRKPPTFPRGLLTGAPLSARLSARPAPLTVTQPLKVSSYHRASTFLPDRYVSNATPHSTPMQDAGILLACAKRTFRTKLQRLRLVFESMDDNNNGLIPASLVRPALIRAGMRLPDVYVKKVIAEASFGHGDGGGHVCKDVYWRGVTLHLSKIKFFAMDGLDEIELSLVADEITSGSAAAIFDEDGDGRVEAHEVAEVFKSFDTDRDHNIGPAEMRQARLAQAPCARAIRVRAAEGHCSRAAPRAPPCLSRGSGAPQVMRTLRTPRETRQMNSYRAQQRPLSSRS